MRYARKLTNMQLIMIWVLYVLLTLFALISDVQAREIVERDSFIDNKSTAAKEVILTDDRPVWLHGTAKGSFVTIGGKAAAAGLYSSKDGKVAFTVDNLGYLTAPVTDMTLDEVDEQFHEAMLDEDWDELE